MTELQERHNVLRREETDAQVWTGIDYEGALCFDMADTLMEWCGLTDELACKQFLTDLNAGGVSTGDFTKACMKVSAVAKEIASVCESFPGLVESIGLMRLLADVDGLIMKSVATTQSLYL
jgi:Na+(H+)/acetate symporter ActP